MREGAFSRFLLAGGVEVAVTFKAVTFKVTATSTLYGLHHPPGDQVSLNRLPIREAGGQGLPEAAGFFPHGV